ncbi:MAG: TetR family transcriptional regulator [Proteobacteria bacterium]|nr:TetR family transcriptional regulator [Pseudomonadota bacterium]
MASARAKRQDAAETVEELLATAERLFAERGVENVALTAIVAEAGQKNRSALHYHFGSRAGVLGAVMERRLAVINARRHALLEALGPGADPAEIVRADVAALGLTVLEAPWGADYISILAQVRFHPQLLGEGGPREDTLSGLRLARRLLRAAAPQIPPELLARRFTWLADAIVFELARWMRDTAPAARTRAGMDALIDDLTAFGTAGMLAPPPVKGDRK